jgi:hypothetical protein
MYCDWGLHDSIDQSEVARRVLDTVGDHIVGAMRGRAPEAQTASPHDHFHRAFSGLGAAALRREWIALHQQFGIRARALESYHNWHIVWAGVLYLLRSTPILLNVSVHEGKLTGLKPNRKLYEAMTVRANGDARLVPTSIEIRKGEDVVPAEHRKRVIAAGGDAGATMQLIDKGYCWIVCTTPDTEIVVVMVPDEVPAAFTFP